MLGGDKIYTTTRKSYEVSEKVEKFHSDPIFSMTSAIFWQKMAKNGQIRGGFQNFVTNYSKMIS